MEKYVVLNKKVGETPLQSLEKYRGVHPELEGVPLAYAGRLDPMAEGKMLVLVGDECKNQKAYHRLDKEYEFEVLFGARSDTGDVLGVIEESHHIYFEKLGLTTVLGGLRGKLTLPYPHYSSKTVDGKQLHTWALEGRIHEIEIPKKDSRIYAIKLLELQEESLHEIYNDALKRIKLLPKVIEPSKKLGRDFRRDEVIASWDRFHSRSSHTTFQVAKIRTVVSSGTYMRTLAEKTGSLLGNDALALSIKRTKVGTYVPIALNLGFWTKQY